MAVSSTSDRPIWETVLVWVPWSSSAANRQGDTLLLHVAVVHDTNDAGLRCTLARQTAKRIDKQGVPSLVINSRQGLKLSVLLYMQCHHQMHILHRKTAIGACSSLSP